MIPTSNRKDKIVSSKKVLPEVALLQTVVKESFHRIIVSTYSSPGMHSHLLDSGLHSEQGDPEQKLKKRMICSFVMLVRFSPLTSK